jgi:hypothetical protein
MSTVAARASNESQSARADVSSIQQSANDGWTSPDTEASHGHTTTPAYLTHGKPESAEAMLVDGAKVSRIAAASIAVVGAPQNQVMAEWHGMVIEVLESTFIAELKGVLGKDVAGAIEEAVIPLDEVREGDRPFLIPGGFFRLTVNMAFRPDGATRHRYTDVTFRRMPAYRREELEDAAERARALARVIRVE